MKHRSFHQRKIRIQEAPELDFGELKARTINALNKLGQQRFSAEPGGYALENWVKGVNVLLDEFEEKAGAARLSQEYLTRRHELNDRLSRPVSISSIDEAMAELRASISEIEGKVEAERALIVSKISELKREETRQSDELERERRRVSDAAAAQRNSSLVNRLFGRNKAQTDELEGRVRELESRLAALPDEVLELQRQLRMIDVRSPGSKFAEEWDRLESMQGRLEELEKERLDRTQLVRERAEATGSVADAISRIV